MEQKPDLDESSLRPDLVVCDVIPNHPRTQLLKMAEQQGAKTIDGLGMLVNQGAINFQLWTGKKGSCRSYETSNPKRVWRGGIPVKKMRNRTGFF